MRLFYLISNHHLRVMSTSSGNAKVIDGTAIAKWAFQTSYSLSYLNTISLRSIRDGVADRIKSMQAKYPRFRPKLAIVQAGARPDSSVYVRMKAKAAEEVGISFQHITLPADSNTEQVVDVVKKLNHDEGVSGILVQLPLGDHVGADGERLVTEAVSPEKDVDGCAKSTTKSKCC
jgi:methylenetetrahydrofolate dehydrogenase (NADP+)/methenyltetrahydrofolate cyclohydrolase/formyltetrahydrofolate synthetase